MVGVAVNVTDEPAQVGFDPEVSAIDTAGTSTGFTVVVMPVLVAVVMLAHVASDVRIQVTICPSPNVDVLNNGELVPAFTPFICH